MELFDVPRVAGAGLGFVPNLLPNSLPNLVARGLSRPTKLTVDLKENELLGHIDVFAHEVQRVLKVPFALAV